MNKTVTNIFMVPTLGINRGTLRKVGYVGAFGSDPNLTAQYENCIYLLFKPKNNTNFQTTIDGWYVDHESLVDDYNYGDYIVLVFKLREDLKEDFDLVRQGRYSEASSDFRGVFPKEVVLQTDTGLEKRESLQHKIFNKDKELREYWEDKIGVELAEDKEVWAMYDEQKETLII